ncbi:MAG TPA: anthranilate phosphoribosyltransferase, partial [bacterium]
AEHILIVHSEDGLDEVSAHTQTYAVELKDGIISEKSIAPNEFGIKPCEQDGVVGGSPEQNADTAMNVLRGAPGPARDIVVANAACGFVVAGATDNFKQGASLAIASIDSGAALQKFEALKELSNRV